MFLTHIHVLVWRYGVWVVGTGPLTMYSNRKFYYFNFPFPLFHGSSFIYLLFAINFQLTSNKELICMCFCAAYFQFKIDNLQLI